MNGTGRNILWIFDFDGTLSPLVADRHTAALHPVCAQMLKDLVKNPANYVAILSSRALDDLSPRVPVRGVFLGGGSGVEWRIPGRHRITIGGERDKRLEVARRAVLPDLETMAERYGVDLEDKKWSVALHTRAMVPADKAAFLARLASWQPAVGVNLLRGAEVIEVQLLSEVNKSLGVRLLCQLLKFDLACGRIVYAGDDENDAVALRWVSEAGGTPITVGDIPLIPGSPTVGDQAELAREVRRLAERFAAEGGDGDERRSLNGAFRNS